MAIAVQGVVLLPLDRIAKGGLVHLTQLFGRPIFSLGTGFFGQVCTNNRCV